MAIILFVSLVLYAFFKGVSRRQTLLAKLTQGRMFVFVTALLSTAITVAGDNSTVAQTTEVSEPRSTVLPLPKVRCFGSSCRGRCGTVSQPQSMYKCSCDMDCIIYQDCCLDFGSLCADGNDYFRPGQILSPPEGTPPQSCIYHKSYFFGPKYMVARCPENYKQQGVSRLCEDDTSDVILHYLPLFERNSSFFYRNVYCAICNSLNMSGLEVLNNTFFCPFNETTSKQHLESRPLQAVTFAEVLEARCKVQIFTDVDKGRECVGLDLDTCPEPGAVKEACQAYLDPLTIWYIEPQLSARNKYCVQCNDFDDKRTRCWIGRTSIDDFGPGFKFSLLFDFTAIDIPGDMPMSAPGQLSGNPRMTDMSDPSLERGLIDYFLDMFISVDEVETFDHLDFLSANVATADWALVKCLYLGAGDSQARKNTTKYYYANATFPSLKYSINKILALSLNLTYNPIRSVRSISGSVRNIRNRLSDVCLSPPRYFDLDTFRERVELFMKRNNVPDTGIPAPFPFEVLWSIPHNDIHFANCHDVRNWCTPHSDCSLPVAAVCGDTLESACEITIFDNDSQINTSVQNGVPELQESLLYQIDTTVVACENNSRETETWDNVELYITAIGCSLSILGLIFTIGTYCSFEQLRNLAGCCILNLVCALLTAQLLFVLGGAGAWRNNYLCQAVAILQHFFWLSTFSWTNIMAFDLARTFRGKTGLPQTGKKRLLWYMVLAWGLPVIIVGTTAALGFTSTVSVLYGQGGICWIRDKYALVVSFVVPVTLHIIFNVIGFTFTIYHIQKVRNMVDSVNAMPERRGQLGVYCRITAVMGFTWVIGYLSNIWPIAALRIVFSGINSLQGFFISVAFVLTSRVIKLYRKKYFREAPPSRKTYVHSTAAHKYDMKK